MKARGLFLVFLCFILCSGSLAGAETRQYAIDPVHSSAVFRIKHLNVAYFYGRFNGLSGEIAFDPESAQNCAVQASVRVENVDTNNPKRDKHLQSADFFHMEKYPDIAFKSLSVKKADEKTYTISGQISFHGKTRPLTVQAKFTGQGKDPWGGYRVGFETRFKLKRSDFGMDQMRDLLGDAVVIYLSLEGVRK